METMSSLYWFPPLESIESEMNIIINSPKDFKIGNRWSEIKKKIDFQDNIIILIRNSN